MRYTSMPGTVRTSRIIPPGKHFLTTQSILRTHPGRVLVNSFIPIKRWPELQCLKKLLEGTMGPTHPQAFTSLEHGGGKAAFAYAKTPWACPSLTIPTDYRDSSIGFLRILWIGREASSAIPFFTRLGKSSCA